MQKNTIAIRSIVIWGCVVWMVPMCVSLLFIDTAGQLTVALPIFLSVISVVLVATTFFAYRNILHMKSLSIEVAHTFLAINTGLDAIMIINFPNTTLLEWVMTVLPLYLAAFYGLYALHRVEK
ncbi:MAG: hypothetical protein RI911_572 [Candidatus Parcubacteria bacterium]